jgi:hypothetical protein
MSMFSQVRKKKTDEATTEAQPNVDKGDGKDEVGDEETNGEENHSSTP